MTLGKSKMTAGEPKELGGQPGELWRMFRAPEAEEHAGMPPDSRPALAAPDGPALREGARRPPRPVLTGPRGPVHPAPGLLRAAAAEASKPRGPWPGRGEGEAPRGARDGVPCHPPGGAVGRRERAWRGRCGAGATVAGARRGLRLSRGRSRLPGVGWRGRPGPQLRCTNRRRTRSRQEAREGGRARGGAGLPGNPSLSGPRRSVRGRGQSADPSLPVHLRSPGPSGIPAPGLSGIPEGAGLSSPPLARNPVGPSGPNPPISVKGQGRGHEVGPLPGGGAFPEGARPRHPELGLVEGY